MGSILPRNRGSSRGFVACRSRIRPASLKCVVVLTDDLLASGPEAPSLRELGMDAVFVKPLDIQSLVKQMADLSADRKDPV